MSVRTPAAGFFAAFLVGATAQAQIQPTVSVQLPTFSFFTVNTTVSVPVSGRGFVGRVYRRRSGSTSHGLPWISGLPAASRLARSRALAAESSARGVSVSATVTDFKKMDDAILAEASARRGAATSAGRRTRNGGLKALQISRHVDAAHDLRFAGSPDTGSPDIGSPDIGLRAATSSGAAARGAGLQSVAEIRRRNAVMDMQQRTALIQSWKQARAAESAGRLGAARCAYHLIARRATGKLRTAALERLAALSPQPEGTKVAKAN